MQGSWRMTALLPCPFCGHSPGLDVADILYPSGIYWREDEKIRHYVNHVNRRDDDYACYKLVCQVHSGGCGAQVHGDSLMETVAAWNRRPSHTNEILDHHRTLAKWLNEEQIGPIDKVALAHILFEFRKLNVQR